MKNPWKTLTISERYSNAWIRLEEHTILNPAGNPGLYGKVHFKNKALGIIPIDQDGNTWLVGQFRYTLNTYSWEIPMGGGLLDVDFLESAKRELKEETGLQAGNWTKIMTLHTSNSVTDEEGYVYLAEDLTEGEPEFEETEVIQLKKLPLSEAVAAVMNGEITDAISCAGLLKVAHLRQI